MSTEWVAGGNLSHPKDLCTLGLGIRNAKVLSNSSLEIMYDFLPITATTWVGHGIFKMQTANGSIWYGHNGSTLGFTGSFFWNEKIDLAVAVLGNVGTMHAGEVPGSAASVIYEGEFLGLAVKLATLE